MHCLTSSISQFTNSNTFSNRDFKTHIETMRQLMCSASKFIDKDVRNPTIVLEGIFQYVLQVQVIKWFSIVLLHIFLLPNRILNDQEIPIERKTPFVSLFAGFYLKRVSDWTTNEYVVCVSLVFNKSTSIRILRELLCIA